jgi:hypothetical protein
MNLFIFYPDFHESAVYFFQRSPKRARKQIVEATQMIAIAADTFDMPRLIKSNGEFYKTTVHRLHPMSLWVRKSKEHLLWTVLYTFELGRVYEKLYKKKHACIISLTNWLKASGLTLSSMRKFSEIEPIFLGAEEYLHHPFNVTAETSIYRKYALYLDNKLYVEA